MEYLSDSELDQILSDIYESKLSIEGHMHPLGFIHAKVDQGGPRKIRLRFWPEAMNVDELGAPDRIHNHSFDFTSHILCGEGFERRYDVTLDPDGDYKIWEVKNHGDSSTLEMTRMRCSLTTREDITHSVGSAYKMKAGVFHDAIALKPNTATMIFETPNPDVPSLVICVNSLTENKLKKWPEVSQEQLKEYVRTIIDARK